MHRPWLTSVHGDLAEPFLGLDPDQYDRLAACIDAVIHCGAITNFRGDDSSLEAANVGGTANIIAFAEAAGARLYHVSTAFVDTVANGERGAAAVRYAATKRDAEELVLRSSVPHVILRPSVVIGDSTTGAVSAFQGIYAVAAALVSGRVPVIPFGRTWPIDFIPSDWVADAIATVVEHRLTAGEYWLTAGEEALTIGDAVAILVAFARAELEPIKAPRFIRPGAFDRLPGRLFLGALPRTARTGVERMLDLFSVYLDRDSPMPSSLSELAPLGAMPLPDGRQSLLASLRYWATTTGRAAALDVEELQEDALLLGVGR